MNTAKESSRVPVDPNGGAASQNRHNEPLINDLRKASATLRQKLSRRYRQNLSIVLDRALKSLAPPTPTPVAYQVSGALLGVPPEPWLGVSDAQRALSALGVKVNTKFLQRLAGKARRFGVAQLEIVINKSRQWGGLSPVQIANPVARLTMRRDGAIQFKVSRY